MYMKNVNDVTGWLSQTTDISKYFDWSPGLWDKESHLYMKSENLTGDGAKRNLLAILNGKEMILKLVSLNGLQNIITEWGMF